MDVATNTAGVWSVVSVAAALAGTGSIATAQRPSPWANVAGWRATYNLSASTSGAGTGYTWTLNRQLTASVNPPDLMTVASELTQPLYLGWTGSPSNAVGSGSSKLTLPCKVGVPSTITWAGSASSAAALNLQLVLIMNLAAKTYLLRDTAVLPATMTFVDCSGPPQKLDSPMVLGPSVDSVLELPSNPLPQGLGALQGTSSFTAPADCFCFRALGTADRVAIPWTLSYKLTPCAFSWMAVWGRAAPGGWQGQCH